MDIQLHRVWSDEDGTRGVLILNFPRFVTLEPKLPIPAGDYQCEWVMSDRFKRNVWRLKDVVGHDGVEFHMGNLVGDTHLCILLGMSFGVVKGLPGIRQSTDALDIFSMLTTGEKELTLKVKDW